MVPEALRAFQMRLRAFQIEPGALFQVPKGVPFALARVPDRAGGSVPRAPREDRSRELKRVPGSLRLCSKSPRAVPGAQGVSSGDNYLYQNGQFASLNAGSDCKKFDFLLFLPQKFAYIKKKQYLCTNKSHHASQRCVPRWDFVVYTGSLYVFANMKYENKPIGFQEQLATLKGYGLQVRDEERALEMLQSISYFRLICYLKCYEEGEHLYREGTLFEDGLMLYAFDNELKTIIFKAIQNVEIALRTRMAHYISMEQGAFWFMQEECFGNKANFYDNLERLKQELQRSHEDFIVEHWRKYDSPEMPPSWKTMEVASMGTLSKMYESLNTTNAKKDVAKSFSLPQYKFLESWNRSMTVLRNCLAHHARVWNRRFTLKPMLPQRLPGKWITNASQVKPHKLYAQLCVLAYMEHTVVSRCDFNTELKSLLARYPMVDVHAMGFPKGWEHEELWRD